MDSDAIIESVKAGDFDGHLVELIEAVRLRFQFGTSQQKWKLTYRTGDDTHEVLEDDLTLGEARLVEKITLTDWGMLNPASSGTECLAIIAACLHTRHGMTLTFTRDGPSGDAWNEASKVTATEAAEAISSYEVERAPKP